jgi:hypothetical protein
MQLTLSEMGCVHTKILFCHTTKGKLHQRRGTGGVINYKACVILRVDNSLHANSVAMYMSSTVMEIK